MATLSQVPLTGWTRKTIQEAAILTNLDNMEADILFPNGCREIIRYWFQMADRLMIDDINEDNFYRLRVRDKITLTIRKRLDRWKSYRPAVKKTVALSFFPGYAEDIFSGLTTTADLIWKNAGDRSTDFNYYTKRSLLVAVYTSTFFYWLQDDSKNLNNTWEFLDRRISEVLSLPKFGKGLKNFYRHHKSN